MACDMVNSLGTDTLLNSSRRSSLNRKAPVTMSNIPQLVLPFIDDVMELNLDYTTSSSKIITPTRPYDYSNLTCLSQIEIVESREKNQFDSCIYRFKEVYIKGVADEYEVYFCLLFYNFLS